MPRSRQAALALAMLLSVGCSDGGGGSGASDPAEAAALRGHVLSRIGYGPDAWSRERIETLGVDAYIEEQLAPESLSDDELVAALVDFPTLRLDFEAIREQYAEEFFAPFVELALAKVLRSVLSRRQLEQVLTDFWYDHFNVYGFDPFASLAIGPYERDAIRANVFGHFEEMLLAVARHAAMLDYLNNAVSTRQGFVFAGKERGLNENYARELLELHTVGVDAGYDQADVIDVARAFTGWTIGPAGVADPRDGFFFWADAHDDDAKEVMGELFIPSGGGMQDGLDVLHFLANHPATAAFLCRRLVERFVSEDAPSSPVVECAETFRTTRGDLRQVMRTLLYSDAFRDPTNYGSKVKRPIALMASMARASDLDLGPAGLGFLVAGSASLGERLYQAQAPTGYPEDSRHWSTGGSLFERFEIVSRLGELDVDWGVEGGSTAEIVGALATRLLARAVDEKTRRDTIAHVDGLGAVSDPERVREAALLLLSSPDFVRH